MKKHTTFKAATLAAIFFLSLVIPAAGAVDCLMSGDVTILLSFAAWYGLTFSVFFGASAAEMMFPSKKKSFPLSLCVIYGVLSLIAMANVCHDARILICVCIFHPVYICVISKMTLSKTSLDKKAENTRRKANAALSVR